MCSRSGVNLDAQSLVVESTSSPASSSKSLEACVMPTCLEPISLCSELATREGITHFSWECQVKSLNTPNLVLNGVGGEIRRGDE